MSRARRVALAVLLVLSTLAVGAAPTRARGAPRGAVLHVDWGGEPRTLDPVRAGDGPSLAVLEQVMEGLTRQGPGGTVLPGIAARWTVSADGRTYSFALRHARWSDGRPVTASDFVYAWRQEVDPCNGAPYAYLFQDVAGAAALLDYAVGSTTCTAAQSQAVARLEAHLGVRAAGAYRLVVGLAAPAPYWLQLTSLPAYFPVEQAAAARWGVGRGGRYGTAARYTVADGPFVVASWVPGRWLDLAPNPRYWDAGAVRLAGVHGLFTASRAAEVRLYQQGALDVLSGSPGALAALAGTPGWSLVPGATVWAVEVNLRNPFLADGRARRALSEAIDRAALAQDGGQGAVPALSYTPPAIDAPPGRSFAALVGARLAAAAAPAAATADWHQALRDLGLAAPPALTLLVPDTPAGRRYGAALEAMWRRTLGLRVTLVPASVAVWVGRAASGQFDLALSAWSADYDDPWGYLSRWMAGSGFNEVGWSDAAFDRDMLRAAAARQPAARAADLAAAERVLLAALPVIPLCWSQRAIVVRPGVSGIAWHVTGPPFSLRAAAKG